MSIMNEPDFELEVYDLDSGRQIKKNAINNSQTPKFRIFNIPLSRWILFTSALLGVIITLLPWLTFSDICSYSNNGSMHQVPCGFPNAYVGIYPIAEMAANILRYHAVRIPFYFFNAIFLSLVFLPGIPGPIFAFWIRGQLKTKAQQVGVILFSFWVICYVFMYLYTIYQYTQPQSPFFGMYSPQMSLTPSYGFYLFVLEVIGYTIGLLQVHKELRSAVISKSQLAVSQQSSRAYLGTGAIVVGFIVWFIYFYGYYWLLPIDCHANLPMFSTVPCWPRESTHYGFRALFNMGNYSQSAMDYIVSAIFYAFGAFVIIGGCFMGIAGWMSHQATQGKWVVIWYINLLALTAASAIGMYRLSVILTTDLWTSAALLTYAGIGLITIGLLLRLRPMARNRTTNDMMPVLEGDPADTLKRT